MLKVENQRPAWHLQEFDKALITATYFGFTPIIAPKITKADFEAVSYCTTHPHYDAAEKAAVIRTYLQKNWTSLPHPLSIVYKRKKPLSYSLHLIGSSTGIAEAMLIRTALSILAEEGYKNLRVDLNCVGDRESLSLYERELINFVKKFGGNLSEESRKALKEDIFNLFRLEQEEAVTLRAGAPSAITYLSAQARSYFKEVLEFIEALGIEFTLAPELVGEKNHCSHTIFAIKSLPERQEGAEELVATGYRYSRLGRRLGMKKEVPMAAASIFVGQKSGQSRIYKKLSEPKFYLVQLGREAKIKTLSLIEELRRERIMVLHFLGKDKLAAQFASAESLRISYLIIIGQKEALDGTATVRNVSTRAQETIPMEMLPQFLKHISL
ncbi:MAG: hypothetical protein HYT69_01015 [Candidatus Zambryskibacteria bacterium]|nr:hypothetical protein [Candidatus Zambryskibacteria bacterium]